MAGGLLIAHARGRPRSYVAVACVALARARPRRRRSACRASPATDPALRINWNPFTETWRNLKLAHGNLVVFRSLLGI